MEKVCTYFGERVVGMFNLLFPPMENEQSKHVLLHDSSREAVMAKLRR